MLRLRLLNTGLAVVFALFAFAQLGDPDGPIWMLLYGIGCFWALVAAAAPKAMTLKPVSMLLSLTMACLLLAIFAFWPGTPNWWQPGVFMEDAAALRAIGLVIVALGMLVPLWTSITMSREERRAEAAQKEAEITARHTGALATGRSD